MAGESTQFQIAGDHEERLGRARLSLEGLSVGDAFGEWFFSPIGLNLHARRELPPKPWPYTDDTAMAISIVEILHEYGRIDQDALADRFSRRFLEEPHRGYGPMAIEILRAIGLGEPWATVSRRAFHGMGSMGNGGAMRAGPIGAWFADDLNKVVKQARLSAEVTHAHAEGQTGAIAIAVAAAEASRLSGQTDPGSGEQLLKVVFEHTPEGPTRDGLFEAQRIDLSRSVHEASRILGNGSRVVSGDTVPFTVWSAAKHLKNYEEAMWATVSAGGDKDTNCAIVGSIVAMATGFEGIPDAWRRSREPLDLICRERETGHEKGG